MNIEVLFYIIIIKLILIGVNHSVHFVHYLDNSVHTNTIERMWRTLKQKIRHHQTKKMVSMSKFICEYIP